ncbi:MAG: hypothetical protein GWP17_01700 [Aquificales bacterium]|nr:hypothetical protein [Aquificales bacterium]
MKQLLWMLLVGSSIMLLSACGGGQAAGPVQVEIISLDHSPIRPAVQEVEAVAAEFGDKVMVQSYNFDMPEGVAFAEERGLTEHTPIAVFVNGEMEFEVNGRSVKFYSFPQGEGTGMVAEGVWTMDDLRAVLEQETN